MSNLSDIGFPASGDEEIFSMIQSVLPFVRSVPCKQGFYYIFTDEESGAEMYLQANHSQELIGFNPHYAGKSKRKVALTKTIERDSSELDGGFEAWANPIDENGEISGDYPFVFDVPNFQTIENLQFPHLAEIQLTAFASNDFQIFASETDYYNSQENEPKFAAKSFVPIGIFQPDGSEDSINSSRPIGQFTGEIKEFDFVTNSVSGEKFYSFLVDTFGGEVDVVADPKLIPSEPQIGGIVSGQFWLSGRLIEK